MPNKTEMMKIVPFCILSRTGVSNSNQYEGRILTKIDDDAGHIMTKNVSAGRKRG